MVLINNDNLKTHLTLYPLDSKLTSIKCREVVNIEALKIFNGSRILKKDKITHYNEFKVIEKYYKETQMHNNGITSYNKANADYKNKFGRVYSTTGLQFIARKIKNTLIKTDPFNNEDPLFNYTDLDMKNAIPSILLSILTNNETEIYAFLQLFKNHLNDKLDANKYPDVKHRRIDSDKKKFITEIINNGFQYLQDYNDNRDEYITRVITAFDTDKATAKMLFSSLLFGGTVESWKKKNSLNKFNENKELNDFIKKFTLEHQIIEEVINHFNPNLKSMISQIKEDKRDNTDNINNSTAAIYLFEIENRILESVVFYLIDLEIITADKINDKPVYNCILEFDGLKIFKTNITDDIINRVNTYVLDTFNIKVEFMCKQIEEFYTSDELQELKNNKLISYDAIKEHFELTNFKVRNPVLFCEIKNDVLIKRDKNEFKTLYENLHYQELDKHNEVKKISFITKWFLDEDIRTYENFDFLPCDEVPRDVYNSFTGFNGEKYEVIKDDIEKSAMWFHIKTVVCGGDDLRFDYFMKWMANILQNPLQKANTALILKGNQGVGKDTLINFIQKIIGNDYAERFDKPDLIFGKFNGSIENKILCVLNESSGKDNFVITENIKDAITRNTTNIHNKGLKPYTVKDACSFIFLTNNDNPIQIPADDRRFFCLEVADTYANNREYFNPLYEEIKTGEYIKAFYNYFKNLDISKYDFINNRPKSDMYEYMQQMNVPIIALFLENLITYYSPYKALQVGETRNLNRFGAKALFDRLKEFIETGNFTFTITSTKFGLDILKYGGITKKQISTGAILTINIQELKIFLTSKFKIHFPIEDLNDDDTYEI